MEKSVIIAASARSGSSGRHVAGRGLRALLAAMTMVIAPLAIATPGEDGDITWTAGSGGVYAPNSYSTLTASTATSITVTNVNDLALPACPVGATCDNSSAPAPPITGATAGYADGNRQLGPGDLLMIYQPQDRNALATTINTTNTADFGAVVDNTTAAHQAGLYEFVYVRSISGNTINIVTTGTALAEGGSSACNGLVNTYDTEATAGVGNGAMVIRVPQLRNLTLGSNHVFSPPAWNGITGGVIALEVGRRAGATPPADTGGVLSFQGTAAIHADGDGFRGGSTLNANIGNVNATGPASVAFFETNCGRGRKGESVFGWSGDTSTSPVALGTSCSLGATGLHVGRAMARGALANGGGGGNPHNGGGGGGANGGLVGSWNGGGNPAAGFSAQWDLEDDVVPVGGSPVVSAAGGPQVISTSTSSGGGRGGYTSSGALSNGTRNSTTWGPQVSPTMSNCQSGAAATSWGGDCRKNQGGLGGRPLDRGTDGVQRVYFGGGGGAAHSDNSRANAAGAAGGGLVFIMAFQIQNAGSAVRVRANGATPPAELPPFSGINTDGSGGGGGGGTVVVLTNKATPPGMTLQANGGAGGNENRPVPTDSADTEAQSGGGGGGGGVVAWRAFSGTPTIDVLGGANGTTNSYVFNGHTAPNTSWNFPPNGATSGGAGESILGPQRNSSPFQCINSGCTGAGCFPTPVTNAWFESERNGPSLVVRFATAAEVGNAGFWVEGATTADGSRREKLSGFVAAQADDPASSRSYEVTIPDTASTHLWLVDVDFEGRKTRRGPYTVGQQYGARPDARQYDWTQAQADVSRSRGAGSGDSAYLTVSAAGMHRVTHEALVAAGVNLAGVPASEIAVLSRSGPVARAVRGPAVFGAGSVVEFYGDPSPDLWSRTERYLLTRSTNSNDIREIPVSVADWGGAQGVSLATARAEHVPPRWFYEPASPSGTPWYQYELTATSGPVSRDLPITVANPSGTAGTLTVNLWGGVNLDELPTPDHHVRIRFNGVEVASRRFDGITNQVFEIPVTNVIAGNNVVRVELPFDTGGFPFDQIVIDGASIEYRTTAEVRNGKFQQSGVTAVATLDERIFAHGIGDAVPECTPVFSSFTNTTNCIPINFRRTQVAIANRTASQSIWVVDADSVRELVVATPNSGLSGDLADSPGSTLIVADRGTLPLPAIEAAPALVDLPSGSAEYVVLTHAAFSDVLAPLVVQRQGQGLTTAVIDVEQLYRRYTAGNAHPDAIRIFMREHAAALGIRFLVLAGGANYNSVGLLPAGVSTLSHIPTPYVPVNQLVNFAPGDALYGDVTGDYVAEVAVGRLPVRTVAEATEAVRKILAYETQPASGRFMLVSGGADQPLGLDFRAAATGFASTLAPSWSQTRVDVDTLGASAARQALTDNLNLGQSVISYTGHSGPIQWGFEPLLTANQVAALPANANQPFLLQFGCWTTYFLSPVSLTMGNAWMLTPSAGASGVFGSTVLLDQVNHDAMAAAIGPRLQSGALLGEALEAARRELATDMLLTSGSEVLVGVTLLGDPAMPLR